MTSKTPAPSSNNGNKEPQKFNSNNIVDFIKSHSRDSIALGLLILGIILILFLPLYGGVLVGIVAGIYFGDRLVDFITHFKAPFGSDQLTHNLIVAGIALAFLISAPAIFLGAAIAIGIKQLFINK